MIVVDTSVLLAMLDASDRAHGSVVDWFDTTAAALVTTPLILVDVDHLVDARLGRSASGAWRQEIARGAVRVEWWPDAEMILVDIADRYTDLGVGLADASLVALANRISTVDVAPSTSATSAQ